MSIKFRPQATWSCSLATHQRCSTCSLQSGVQRPSLSHSKSVTADRVMHSINSVVDINIILLSFFDKNYFVYSWKQTGHCCYHMLSQH